MRAPVTTSQGTKPEQGGPSGRQPSQRPRRDDRPQREGDAGATVFVVDDDQAMRESLRWLLESAELRVDTYASAEEFLQRFDPARPGCLVVDMKMPAMSGLDLQRELAARDASIPLIFITAFGEISTAVRACREGALDFIEKPFSDRRLLDAIGAALTRDRMTRREKAARARASACLARLTGRERDVMALVVDGKTNKQIATELGLSPRTVEVHRGRLMDKLGVRSLADLVRLWLRGVLGAPPDTTGRR